MEISHINKMKILKKYALITIAAVLYAFGVALFLNPNDIAPGGVSGMSMILARVVPLDISLGLWIIMLNIPIMLIGAKMFGKRYVASTLYTLVLSSMAIDWVPEFFLSKRLPDDLLLNAIIGGTLMGVAMGIVFRLDSSTGGSDVVVKIIRQYKPDIKSGQLFLIIDGFVILLSTVVFKEIAVGLYAAIAVYVSSMIMNKTLYGADEAFLLYIVSDKKEEIKEEMLKEINVGMTLLNGSGAYTGKSREIIMCVIRKQSLAKVRKLIKRTDSNSFMIISKAEQVFGEGFKNPYKPEQ